jgi:hypothetical protein|nr:MAG TPA: hypothetical protein [Bacteriophage sp.]
MRVISQHGNVDLPYEQIVVCHAMESVIALYNGERYLLGEYSSKEKSYKVMEMLRKAYIGMPIVMQNVAISEDVAKEFERLKKCGIMVRTENQPSKVECLSNAIFQFPQDDEIEV